MTKFVSGKIHIDQNVVVFKNNVPYSIASIFGGNKSSLDVLFDENGGHVRKFQFDRRHLAYINNDEKMCLYFLGAPPHFFEETDE